MKTELATIVPHIFGHHEQCSPTWCTYVKDPTKFRFKHLPNGKALSGDKLREELDKLAQNYIERADRLLNLGSTQSNESFNNSVASFAPKNRFYGGTKSLKARVSSAVMQKNEGYGWLSKVNKKSLLSPGHLTILHGIRKDRRRKQIRKTQSTTNFKRKRLTIKEFMLHIYGCIDTIKLARRKFKTKDIGNHKQQTLVTKLLGVEYDAHNACADVTSLFQLLEHFEYSEKDVFPFNSALLTDSYIPLIRASRITKLTARRLAHSGLCLKHLQLAFNRDSENGLKSILLEHGFNAKTVTSFTKYFTCTEE
ncbi:Hypothetical predicted protein [Mytilus galloprovincialis]|uniref:PML C-terminal domain-containing protein n=1 Tax=Mytilus galloprovincialis TaxID=29158 RepID=A0A8B6GS78_MYTGA|nr:Hypothetical predicted protein [Mytilus galloprovincialis]